MRLSPADHKVMEIRAENNFVTDREQLVLKGKRFKMPGSAQASIFKTIILILKILVLSWHFCLSTGIAWFIKNSGQMRDKKLLIYEEYEYERNSHYVSNCRNLDSSPGLYSA